MIKHTVYIMRGLPGSGKSTEAGMILAGLRASGLKAEIVSSDFFFTCRSCGDYRFRLQLLPIAHQWCRDEFARHLRDGVDAVIVDNTNISTAECKFYVQQALAYHYAVEFKEPFSDWAFDIDRLEKRNAHGVPRQALEKMLARWVPCMTIEKALAATGTPDSAHCDEKAAAGLI